MAVRYLVNARLIEDNNTGETYPIHWSCSRESDEPISADWNKPLEHNAPDSAAPSCAECGEQFEVADS